MKSQTDKKPDIRELKTVDSIYDAFLTLISGMTFAEITVKGICECARISRSTFYDHFEDKYHLLKMLLKYISDDTSKDFVYFTENSPAAAPMLALSSKYRRLFREIFLNNENAVMRDIYHDVISSDIKEKICIRRALAPKEIKLYSPELEVISDFYAEGIMSVIKTWCAGKTPLDRDEMASIIRIMLKNMHEQGDLVIDMTAPDR